VLEIRSYHSNIRQSKSYLVQVRPLLVEAREKIRLNHHSFRQPKIILSQVRQVIEQLHLKIRMNIVHPTQRILYVRQDAVAVHYEILEKVHL
jgi:hypothetical protein